MQFEKFGSHYFGFRENAVINLFSFLQDQARPLEGNELFKEILFFWITGLS